MASGGTGGRMGVTLRGAELVMVVVPVAALLTPAESPVGTIGGGMGVVWVATGAARTPGMAWAVGVA